MDKPENPPAFPNPYYSNVPGMTLRDWYAGQALAGLAGCITGGYIPTDEEYKEAAVVSLCLADALLAARGEA
jgi:hypothetical protein